MPAMRPGFAALGILVWVLVLFAPSVTHPFVMWDDPVYVMLNPTVNDWWLASWRDRLLTPRLLYPVPVPVAIYAVMTTLLGAKAAMGIHAISVVLHAANAVMVFALCQRLGQPRNAAIVSALVWASHPLGVESVAWATNLKELLMTASVLGALLLVTGPRRAWWGLIPVMILGFGSKPTFAVVGPLVLLLAWHQRDKVMAGLGGLMTALGAAFVLVFRAGHDPQASAALAVRDELVTIGKAAGLQVFHIGWPVGLQPYYPLSLQTHDVISALGFVAYALGLGAAGLFVWRRQVWALGLTFALLAWLPYSNLMPLPRFTADTYAYLPMIGCAVALSTVIARYGRRAAVAGAGVAIILGLLTAPQIQRWQDTQTLWGPLLGQPETLALPYTLIAFEAHLLGDNERAARLLDEAWLQIVAQLGKPGFADNVYAAVGRTPPGLE